MRILFVTANAYDTHRLNIAAEVRLIEREVRAAARRREVMFKPLLAASINDLHEALLAYRPHVVWFSLHGDGGRMYFETERGDSQIVPADAIAAVLHEYRAHIRLVVFNMCDSESLAARVVHSIDCAIGLDAPIHDNAARTFAQIFYRELVAGRSVAQAFRLSTELRDVTHPRLLARPALFSRTGIDPDALRWPVSFRPDIQPSDGASAAYPCSFEPAAHAALDEIRHALTQRELIVVAGHGIGEQAGLPSHASIAATLCEQARRSRGDHPRLRRAAALAVAAQIPDALSELRALLGEQAFCRQVERLLDDSTRNIPAAAQALAALTPRVRAVMTTCVDRLLERALAGTWPAVTRPTAGQVREGRAIFKLCGALQDRASWVITRDQHDRAAHDAGHAYRAFATAYGSRILLLVGYSPDDPALDALLTQPALTSHQQPPTHYALVATETHSQVWHRRLQRAGVQTVPFDGGDTPHQALANILYSLANP